jgi:hypothetical protein
VRERIAERTGQRFLEVPPLEFRGRVQVLGRDGGAQPYAVVSDGARFVVVRAAPEVYGSRGKNVRLSRDEKGKLVVRSAPDRSR